MVGRCLRRLLVVGRCLRRLLDVLMRGGLGGCLLKMLGLLVVLRMLGSKVVHIMLLVVVLIMVVMVAVMLGGVEVVHNLLIVSTWLGLGLRMLLSELDLDHWAWVVVDRPRWVVQGGLLVPRVGGGIVRLGRVPRVLPGGGRSCLGWGVVGS